MTINGLLSALNVSGDDLLAIYDKEAAAGVEPTQKIKVSDFITSIITLGTILKQSDIVNNLDSTATDKPLSANMGRALNEIRQLTITAGPHTAIDENDSYICGRVMVINFKCYATSAIGATEKIADIEETTIFDCVVPLVVGGKWAVTGVTYGYVTGKSVLADNVNNGQYIHVNFTTLLA